MRIRWTTAAALAAAVTGGARAEDRPAPPDLGARIDAYVKPLVELGLFSGAVLVAKDGRILVEAAYGEADVEASRANDASTGFKLMSVSKSLTAVAVLRLAQEGKLDLEEAAGKRLPDWPLAWREVTVRQLLDHTSGIANLEAEWAAAARQGTERGLKVWAELAPSLARASLATPPGTRFGYSNFNYVLLGLVVEAATGRPYPEVLRSTVLEPAGMKKTGFDDGTRRPGLSVGYFRGKEGAPEPSVQDMSVIQAAGGLYSTVGDLYRLDRALRGDALLSPESRARMQTPMAMTYGYACGWQVSRVHDRPCVHHSGGANGYVADLLRFPDDDACVVVLSNFAFAPAGRVSHDLAGLLFGRSPAPARTVAPATLAAWTGVYRPAGSSGRALLVRRSGGLLILFDVNPGVERCGGRLLVPVAEDLFVPPWGDERLQFAAAADGRPASVRMEPPPTTMERVDPPVAAWRAAAGEYASEPPDAGPARISESGGRLVLSTPAGWPPEQEIVPLTETLALALYSEEFGTLLHLERDGRGRAVGFRRQQNDGKDVRGVRQGR
jgi:CubicO group peptidase (beta-lactamase class C family)